MCRRDMNSTFIAEKALMGGGRVSDVIRNEGDHDALFSYKFCKMHCWCLQGHFVFNWSGTPTLENDWNVFTSLIALNQQAAAINFNS